MIETGEVKISVGSNGEAAAIFGLRDENLRLIEHKSGTKIVARGNVVMISGDKENVQLVTKLFDELIKLLRCGNSIDTSSISYAWEMLGEEGLPENLVEILTSTVLVTPRGKQIKAKTLGQQQYIKAMQDYDIVFAIGPAGTGKTYLAVVAAVVALRNREVGRIVLTRPAVEAGEKLGFLPGDLQDKVNPYLRPLYDGLYDVLGNETAEKYLEKGTIEIAPLAYMRGRTLEDAFIILDEAQNTSAEQMKMFLTRIGIGSKAVITGDVTQIDLPRGQKSGLIDAQEVLEEIKGISFNYLSEADVIRHPLVRKIVQAYEKKGRAEE